MLDDDNGDKVTLLTYLRSGNRDTGVGCPDLSGRERRQRAAESHHAAPPPKFAGEQLPAEQFEYSGPMMPVIGFDELKPPTLNSHVLAPFKQGASYTDTLFHAAVIQEAQGAGRRMTKVKYADD